MTNFKHFIIKHSEIIAITALAAVTLFFRFYKLSSIPFGLNNDAAWEGSAAYDILRRNITQYLPYAADGWRGEGIIRVFVAVFTIVLGNNPIAIRLASTVFSVSYRHLRMAHHHGKNRMESNRSSIFWIDHIVFLV